jgi:Nucleoside-diphosphate-sugar epimerases
MKLTKAVEDDPQRRKPNIDRAKTYLQWEPKVSLNDGLKKTIEYFAREVKRSQDGKIT